MPINSHMFLKVILFVGMLLVLVSPTPVNDTAAVGSAVENKTTASPTTFQTAKLDPSHVMTPIVNPETPKKKGWMGRIVKSVIQFKNKLMAMLPSPPVCVATVLLSAYLLLTGFLYKSEHDVKAAVDAKTCTELFPKKLVNQFSIEVQSSEWILKNLEGRALYKFDDKYKLFIATTDANGKDGFQRAKGRNIEKTSHEDSFSDSESEAAEFRNNYVKFIAKLVSGKPTSIFFTCDIHRAHIQHGATMYKSDETIFQRTSDSGNQLTFRPVGSRKVQAFVYQHQTGFATKYKICTVTDGQESEDAIQEKALVFGAGAIAFEQMLKKGGFEGTKIVKTVVTNYADSKSFRQKY